jgi:hypothetical protein
MKNLLIVTICMFFHIPKLFSYGEPLENKLKPIKCSLEGIGVIYINGADTTHKHYEESIITLRTQIYHTDSRKHEIDFFAQVDISGVYNQTQGLFLDFLEEFSQEYSDEEGKRNGEDIIRRFKFLNKLPKDKNLDEELRTFMKYEMTYPPDQADTLKLSQAITNRIDVGKRVITVSHGQGNLFANAAYELIVQHGNSNLDIYANLQVGSPTAPAAPQRSEMKIEHDIAQILGNEPNLLHPGRYIYEAPDNPGDNYNHDFVDTYLSTDIPVFREDQELVDQLTMRDYFRQQMNLLASKFSDTCDPISIEIPSAPETFQPYSSTTVDAKITAQRGIALYTASPIVYVKGDQRELTVKLPFTSKEPGTYIVDISAMDRGNGADSAYVEIEVPNSPPTGLSVHHDCTVYHTPSGYTVGGTIEIEATDDSKGVTLSHTAHNGGVYIIRNGGVGEGQRSYNFKAAGPLLLRYPDHVCPDANGNQPQLVFQATDSNGAKVTDSVSFDCRMGIDTDTGETLERDQVCRNY